MKKTLLTALLVSTGSLVSTASALAVEESRTTEYKSDISIRFENENGSNTEGPYSGRLSFTFAPKSYNFGSQKLQLGTGISYNLETVLKDSQYVVVNEDRKNDNPDFGKGWNVKVKMSELSSDEEGKDKIPAELSLGLENLQSYDIGTTLNSAGDDVDPAKPWNDGVMTDFSTAPTDVKLNGSVLTIPADGQTEVRVMAQDKQRVGESRKREGWGTKITDQKLKFVSLDASVAEKAYTGQLTWTLARDIDNGTEEPTEPIEPENPVETGEIGEVFDFFGEEYIYLKEMEDGSRMILRKNVITTKKPIGNFDYNLGTGKIDNEKYFESLSQEAKEMVQPIQTEFDQTEVVDVSYYFSDQNDLKTKYFKKDKTNVDFNGEKTAFSLSPQDLSSVSGKGLAFPTLQSRGGYLKNNPNQKYWWQLRGKRYVGNLNKSAAVSAAGIFAEIPVGQKENIRPALIIKGEEK